MAKYCTNCGAQNPDTNIRCTNCGQPLPTPQPVGMGTGTMSGGGYGATPYGNVPLNYTPNSMGNFFSFRMMVTPMVIRVLYVIGAIGITIAGIVLLVESSNRCDSYGYCNGSPGAYVLGGLLVMTFGNLYWRIVCEMAIIFFSIHDRLRGIESESRKK